MAELKTQKTDADVDAFIDTIEDEGKREDCRTLLAIMGEATGEKPALWGPAIVGFGSYRYRYSSGREGEWFVTGFSPRKQALTLYIMDGFKRRAELMERLGKHKTGKSCLYVKRLSDVDGEVLRELIVASVDHMNQRDHGAG